MNHEKELMEKLIYYSWKLSDESDRIIVKEWLSEQDLIPGYLLSPTSESEELLLKLMVNPLLRGLALVFKNVAPYKHDKPLITAIRKQGRNTISTLQKWGETNVSEDVVMIFLAPNQQAIDEYIKYLIPTYILTTWRSSKIIAWSELLKIASDSLIFVDAKDHLIELEESGLLVLEDLDCNMTSYKKLRGLLTPFFRKRARSWRSTIIPVVLPSSLTQLAMNNELTLRHVIEFFSYLGLSEKDPLAVYIYGQSAHVVYLSVENNNLVYKKILTK
jgi:hypothetical protein